MNDLDILAILSTTFFIANSIIFVILGFVVYAYVFNKNILVKMGILQNKDILAANGNENIADNKKKDSKINFKIIIILTFLFAIILRIIFAVLYNGHQDITYFSYWLNQLQENSFYNYYDKLSMPEGVSENSYLPGYLYILYILGSILKLLNIPAYYVLLKLPSIFCDVIAAFFIYKFAKKYFNYKAAFAICLLYLFNPAIILNSSFWGQVDSFTALFSVLSLYYLSNKKFILSFIFVAIGMAFKLQFSFILPIIIIYTIYILYQYYKQKQYKKMLSILYATIIMAVVFIVLTLPFTLKYMLNGDLFFVFKVYFHQTDTFNYFVLNTFNFYSMILKNWVKIPDTKILGIFSYNTFNYIIIAIISIYCMVLTLYNKSKNSLYLASSILILGVFTFSMKMHERYSYVALILLLVSAIISKDKRIYTAFIIFTLLQFLNTGVLLFKVPEYRYFTTDDTFLIIFSNISVFYFIYFAITVSYSIFDNKKKKSIKINKKEKIDFEKDINENIENFDNIYNQTQKIREKCKLVKKDYIIMSLFFVIYFLFNLINLGGTTVPVTWWEVKDNNEYIILEISDNTILGEIWSYKGIDIIDSENHSIKVYGANALTEDNYADILNEDNFLGKRNITNNGTNNTGSMYKWFKVTNVNEQEENNIFYKYIAITASSNVRINEIVLLEKDSKSVIDYNIIFASSNEENAVSYAFDEKETFLGYNSLMTDMYFDEIYHARTAFEHINGWTPYEVTHPPLGKIIISIGIRIFGMNPFGWRISGVLFSALLLPVIYVLGRQLFKQTKWAVLFALFFALSGLNFVQGRIATIDTYPVFFSSLSMLFMIIFFRTNILRENIFKCLLPFALSGMFFGLAAASKWTGLYTGAGLFVLLIIYIYKMLNEYRYNAAKIYKDKHSYKKYSKDFDYKLVYIILTGLIFFILIPFTIYLLSYLPYMTEEKSLSKLFEIMIDNQIYMYKYHSVWVANIPHQCQSAWYSWFVDFRSVFMYKADDSFNMYARIHSLANPIICYVGTISLLYCIFTVFKKHIYNFLNNITNSINSNKKTNDNKQYCDKYQFKPLNYQDKEILIILFIGLLSAIIPWVFVERTTFIYHFYPSMPYFIGLIIFSLKIICKKQNKKLYCINIGKNNIILTKGNLFTGIITAIILIFFVMLYPVFAGIPINYNAASILFGWLNFIGGHVGL